jgi:hypothetical protein
MLSNQFRNWSDKPGDFHAKNGTREPKAEGSDCSPAKWQQFWFIPSVPIVSSPAIATSTTKEDVLFSHHDKVDDCPVADNAQECLESVCEEFGCEASNDDCGDEAKCDQYDAGNANGPRAEVLGVHGE